MRKSNINISEVLFGAIALGIAISIFLKAIFDMDTNYDVGWYHLPFAARIWGIIPESAFMAGAKIEHRYDGFPLLAHFFQGFFWKITGRVQAANLVNYFSLIFYFIFLKSYFKVPLYISTIAIFTIPAVLTHAPTGFVDLPGNIGVSVVVMMTYAFFRCSTLPSKPELLIAFVGAIIGANIKPQLQPIVFILYLVVGLRIIWLCWTNKNLVKLKLRTIVFLSVFASLVIFATPIKNVALYGNPFYPIKIEVGEIVLNHQMTPKTYSEGNRTQKWLRSVFEINTPEWSADQSNRTNEKNYLDRAGGYFRAYVIFNLLLLTSVSLKEQHNRRILKNYNSSDGTKALVIIALVSLVPANFPQSHELRYLMFWMITLVSLNLCLLFSSSNVVNTWFKPKYLRYVYLLFFILVCIKIKSFYLKPDFRDLKTYVNKVVNSSVLEQIAPNQTNCLISRHGLNHQKSIAVEHAFYYSSYFHPEIGYDYGIKVAPDIESCGDYKIIVPNDLGK